MLKNALLCNATVLASLLFSPMASPQIPAVQQATDSWRAGLTCQQFDFNQAEMQKCVKIYRHCEGPDMRPSEFKPCVIKAVKTGELPPQRATNESREEQAPRPPSRASANMQFSFTATETRDLLAMCDHPSNQSTALCTTVLRDKRRILQALR